MVRLGGTSNLNKKRYFPAPISLINSCGISKHVLEMDMARSSLIVNYVLANIPYSLNRTSHLPNGENRLALLVLASYPIIYGLTVNL